MHQIETLLFHEIDSVGKKPAFRPLGFTQKMQSDTSLFQDILRETSAEIVISNLDIKDLLGQQWNEPRGLDLGTTNMK